MSPQQQLQSDLKQAGYIASFELVTALGMMELLERPLLLEGEAGVGKTEVAKSYAKNMGRRLIRLQCYEGLDASNAIYEWNYQRQILAIKLMENEQADRASKEDQIFSTEFLLKRPLLESITQKKPPVLLIDEIDRADEEFEAYLLEVLSDYQITIPEIGTIKATSKPTVILTSNGTRELSDALRRRCLYHYVDFPDSSTELQILQTKIPDCDLNLASQIVQFVQNLRKEDLKKKPGIAETLDWAAALLNLDISQFEDDIEAVHLSLLCLLKTREDRDAIGPEVFGRIAGRSS